MKLILKLMIFLLNIIYFIFKLLPTQNKVLFMSRQSNNKSVDMRLLRYELKKEWWCNGSEILVGLKMLNDNICHKNGSLPLYVLVCEYYHSILHIYA